MERIVIKEDLEVYSHFLELHLLHDQMVNQIYQYIVKKYNLTEGESVNINTGVITSNT